MKPVTNASIRVILCLFLMSCFPYGLLAQAASSTASAVKLMPGFGNAHHKVSTTNPQAQAFFDQGMDFIFGFNHVEAEKSFQRAAELDPNLGMAYWGIAKAVGPNYNLP